MPNVFRSPALNPLFSVATLKHFPCVLAMVAVSMICSTASGQRTITLDADMVLDNNALLMPSGSQFGRAINGRAHQSEPLVSFGGFQFATWYRNGANDEQDIFLARRDLSTNTWDFFDTGYNFENGDEDGDGSTTQRGRWDSHNAIALGVSGDGRIHLTYDHHVDNLRYLTTRGVGRATLSNEQWRAQTADAANSFFVPGGERSRFNAQDSGSVTGVTYPRFAPTPNGDTVAVHRRGSSGNGDTLFTRYNSGTTVNSDGVLNQRWSDSHVVIDGNAGSYTDDFNDTISTNRNPYLNGIDAGPDGTLHMTWTWRESPSDPNHDILYAYSEDGGNIWRNNDGQIVANKATGLTIDVNSPGIEVVELDRRESLINQQAQTVDGNGVIHALMWHRRDDDVNGEFDFVEGERFVGAKSAYYHYHRDPITGEWLRNQLPTSERVGSRPKLGHDANGDLYAIYTSRGDLIVAGATRDGNYEDWEILYKDERNFVSDPLLDQDRLFNDGVLSVFIQDNGPASNEATGTPLRVLEFNVNVSAVPEPTTLALIPAAGLMLLRRRRRVSF